MLYTNLGVHAWTKLLESHDFEKKVCSETSDKCVWKLVISFAGHFDQSCNTCAITKYPWSLCLIIADVGTTAIYALMA